ncbi:MAG: 1-acyl-sn-glycerol-3-phosphate acyltransferase [Chloroflexota bacterium]|nr:1-acyl-sn-glycerol-3-phosphate acyltransferase [Chloroflexota bacterium]
MRSSTDHSAQAAHPAEPPVRYTLAGGRIGVDNLGAYLRTTVEATFWLGAAPLPTRLLWRIHAYHASRYVQRWWARGVSRTLALQIDWNGLDHIDSHTSYVVTPLHEGLVDALAVLQLPLPLRFVVRDEFVDWRLLGTYLRDTEQIAIRPEDGTRAYRTMLRGARVVLARGESLVVFPQGSILGIETDFLPGAFALARALQRPILPIALTGSHRVWEYPYTPRVRRGERMSVQVLPPIAAGEVCEWGIDELRQEVQRRLKAAAFDRTMAPPRRFVPARDGYWDGYAYEIDPAFPDLAADVAAHRAGWARRS